MQALLASDAVDLLHEPQLFNEATPGIYIAEARYAPFATKYHWKSVRELCAEYGKIKLWENIQDKYCDELLQLTVLGEHPALWAHTLASLSKHGYYLDRPFEFGFKHKDTVFELDDKGDILHPDTTSWICIDGKKHLHGHVSNYSEFKSSPTENKVMIAMIGNTGNKYIHYKIIHSVYPKVITNVNC